MVLRSGVSIHLVTGRHWSMDHLVLGCTEIIYFFSFKSINVFRNMSLNGGSSKLLLGCLSSLSPCVPLNDFLLLTRQPSQKLLKNTN